MVAPAHQSPRTPLLGYAGASVDPRARRVGFGMLVGSAEDVESVIQARAALVTCGCTNDWSSSGHGWTKWQRDAQPDFVLCLCVGHALAAPTNEIRWNTDTT